ncbi:hypothetical protein AK830_g6418 [Neonectria ditissima]|uniref:Transcription factor domain-containing protein n=1 Tax=Neonectria ditissima TaxID=78410 RepID=A0A0P7BCC9_9HYPO|nr:hypothetical protein AK830_g6418 [Neonectria ditissima]
MVFKTCLPPLPFEPPDDVPISRFMLEDRWGRQPAAKSRHMYTCGVSGASYSVDNVSQRVEAIAAALGHLLSWSPNQGSEWAKVVAIFSHNSIDTVPAMWATHRLSGIVTPIHASSVASEVTSQLKQTGSKALFTCRCLIPVAASAAKATGIPLEHIFLLDVAGDVASPHANTLNAHLFRTVQSLVELGKSRLPLEQLSWRKGQGASQVAFICFSSGTSGLPKGVKVSHRNIIANVMQLAVLERSQRAPGATAVTLGLLPQSHIYPLVVISHACAYRGDEVVVLPKYELHDMLRAVSKHSISILFLVPPILLDCIRNEKQVKKYDLSCATDIMTGAASFSAGGWATIQQIMPNGLLRQGYGLTEVAAVVSSSPKHDLFNGSSGPLLSGVECKIVDQDSTELIGLDQPGELWVKSPSVALGYLNNEVATSETFVDGWMRTGDKAVFRKSPGGKEHVFIIDRIKELIKVKSMQVAPAELEAHILEHPDAVDAAVIAVDDDRNGELPKAFIVKRAAATFPSKQAHAGNQCSSSRPRDPDLAATPPLPNTNQEIEDQVYEDKCDSVHPKGCHDVQKSNPARSASVTMRSEFAVPSWRTASEADELDPTNSPRGLSHLDSNFREARASHANGREAFDYSLIDALTPFLYPSNPDPSVGRASRSATVVFYTYYEFLTINNASQIFPQDYNFLETEACFHVPTKAVLDELVHQYFSNLHPHLPLLSEADFWESYRADDPSAGSKPQLSLLVFQAMLFAASNFVSLEKALLLKYYIVRDLRADLYRKTKGVYQLLHDFNTEKSAVAIAQAALLLSYWTPPLNGVDEIPNSRWLAVAIENSLKAEAHVKSAAEGPRTSEHKMLRRLWWCCILRDRLHALGLRRSILLTRAHFDFERHLDQGCAEIKDEILRSQVHGRNTRADLANVVCKTIELSVVLTDILLLVFPFNKGLLVPEETAHRKAKGALNRWFIASGAVRYKAGNSTQDHCVTVLANLMLMCYHSTALALSYHVLQTNNTSTSPPSPPNSPTSVDLVELSDEIQQATLGITECLNKLNQLQLTRCLPITAVAYFAFPLTLYVLDVHLSGPDHHKRSIKMQRLGILIDAMKVYYSQYHGVEWVAKIVRRLPKQLETLSWQDSPADWIELLILHSDPYVQLTLALDWSLRDGRCPKTDNFKQLHDRPAVSFDAVAQDLPLNEGAVQDSSGCSSAALDSMPALTGMLTPTMNADTDEYAVSCAQVEPDEQSGGLGMPDAASNDSVNLDVDLHAISQNDETTSVPDLEADMIFFMGNWDNDLLS